MLITLSANLSSPLITNGRLPVGPTSISSTSSNVILPTANEWYVSTHVPLVTAPDVCVGSVPVVPVVPAVVTSYRLFFHLR